MKRWTIETIAMPIRLSSPVLLRCHVSPSRRWAIRQDADGFASVTHLPSGLHFGWPKYCSLRDICEWCDLADEALEQVGERWRYIDDAEIVREHADELRAILTSAGRLW